MKTLAEIGLGWLAGSGLLVLGLALYEAWRTPSRGTRCEILGKEVG